jgi:arabinan endo-1,5-alpha-L-arabinosidase
MTFALHNQDGVHDPSAIIKCDDTYWIYGTGRGPHAMYSTDLVHWTEGQTPLPEGTFPSWVLTYVPDFEGHFWAPDCFYMDGEYHLYYSCSSWGSTVSCIGLLTGKSLNPGSPDYGWTDEGLVVASNASSNYNCIDPAIMKDRNGKVWLTYGSHWDGIRIVELDSLTGKTTGSTYSVAGKGDYKTEAAYLISRGDYYYLFFNRGQCCQGASSTYYIQVGRSANPTGPFLDKNGTDCYQGGGTTVVSTSGQFIGPGCLGYYVENNTEYVTYHYYDGADGGIAKLAVSTFSWSMDGWPSLSRDWIDEGHYSIANVNSGLVWDFSGAGDEDDPIVQNAYKENSSQKWTFESQGDGYYSIIPGGRDLLAGISPCTANTGTELALCSSEITSCKTWRIEKTAGRGFVFSSKYGNRVAEIPGTSMNEGVTLAINIYEAGDNQQWVLQDTFLHVTDRAIPHQQNGIRIYPNPAREGNIHIEFSGNRPVGDIRISILASDGRQVYNREHRGDGRIRFYGDLYPGTYILNVKTDQMQYHEKLIIQQ